MRLRVSAPAGARRSNLIPMGPALCWVVMAAAPSIKTALLAVARISVPKPGACIPASTWQISSSALKLSMNASEAAAHALWKPPSVMLWPNTPLPRCLFTFSGV